MAWKIGDYITFTTNEEVSHVVGSGEHKGNWKSYWEKHNRRSWPQFCSMFQCRNPPTDGAHVYPKKQGNRQNFIIPTCHRCNANLQWQSGNGFGRVKADTRAVWAVRHSNTFQ